MGRKIRGLSPTNAGLRLGGGLQRYWDKKRQRFIVRQAPKSNGGDTPARRASRQDFTYAAWLIKYANMPERVAAETITAGTPLLPRDALMLAAFGKLNTIRLKDGTLIQGVRTVAYSIQYLLDTIINTPGAILVRGASAWLGLVPGASGNALVIDPDTGLPVYADVSPTAAQLQALLDDIGSDIGDMLIRTADGWVVLEAGDENDVLTSGGAGTPFAWAPPSGGGGGADTFHPGYIAGRYYVPPLLSNSLNTTGIATTSVYAVPFFVASDTTFSKMSCNVSTNSSLTEITFGVYADANGQPGALEWTAPALAMSGTGVKEQTGLDFALTTGWHWLALAPNGAASLTNIGNANTQGWLTGLTTLTSVAGEISGANSYASGVLPDPFPSIVYGTVAPVLLALRL